MIDRIKNELLDIDDEFLIISDNEIIDHSKNISSFDIESDIKLKVIYLISQNTKIEFNLKNNINIKLTEVFYEIKDNVELVISHNVGVNTRVDYLSLRKTNDINQFKVITNIALMRDAYINIKELSVYDNPVESSFNIYLNDINTNVEVRNVYINSTSKNQYFKINTYHMVGDSNADIKVYGLSKNNSLLTVDTLGVIKKDASRANLSQKTKGLILDEFSNISANPILEIDHFDCLAAHGASIGAIDDEELYYLMSRGLTKEDSEKLIIGGFITPFFNEIEEEKLRDKALLMLNPYI